MNKLKRIMSITIIICMLAGYATVTNAASSMSGSTEARVYCGTDYHINTCSTSGERYCRIEASNIVQSLGGINLYNEVYTSSICIISTTMHSNSSTTVRYSFKTPQNLTYKVANLTPNSNCKARFSWNYNF